MAFEVGGAFIVYFLSSLFSLRTRLTVCLILPMKKLAIAFLLDYRLPRTRLGITGASSVLLSLLPRFAPRQTKRNY